MMPEMDGFEFAERMHLHPEWRSIPLVVVTAMDLNAEDRRRLNGYVETVLHKGTSTREALLDQVRSVVSDCLARCNSKAVLH